MARAKRTNRIVRRQHILESAIEMAVDCGHKQLTRDAVALHVGVASSLIAKYYPSILDLKRAVLSEAISRPVIPILSHCLTTCELPPELKRKVLKYLS